MSRLTIKNSDGSHSQAKDTSSYNMFFKLSELEDVLEEFGIKSVEELRKRLSKAIVPKFKITQDVYIVDTLNKNLYKTQICSIRIFDGYEFAYYCKYDNDNHEKICIEVDEEFVFTTETEAQAKLDEIRRKQ